MRKGLSCFKGSFTKREMKLFLLFAFFLVFCTLYLVFAPRIFKLNTLKAQLMEVNKEKSSYESLYEKYYGYDKILDKYSDLLKKVPAHNDLSGFLIDMEKWTEDLEITLISIVPQKYTTGDFTDIEVSIVPCDITVGGDFNSLLSFVAKLENYSRVSQIDELRLTKTIENTLDSNVVWTLTVKISLYYFPQTT